MRLFRSMEISASGLSAERLRMDVIANNLANANSTRATRGADGRWQPYRRQSVLFAARDAEPFAALLRQATAAGTAPAASAGTAFTAPEPAGRGVNVVGIVQDPRPFKLRYEPGHPDADARGYVFYPNVDVVTEMVDLITASRAYEANATAINAAKSMAVRALEIGRG